MSSSSSSESEDESFNNIRGMKPYMYEPTKSKTNIEYEEISSASECSDDSDVSTTATRIRNITWCQCGKCMPMQTSVESLCCREMSEICEARYAGIKYFSIKHISKLSLQRYNDGLSLEIRFF